MKNIFTAQHHQIREIELYVQSTMPELDFHNYNHVKEVTGVAMTLATYYYLPVQKRFALNAGMLLHDEIYKVGATNNEELSARDAERILGLLGASTPVIRDAMSVIRATKNDSEPRSLIERIAKDADRHNIGTPYFFETSERVRAEFPKMTDFAWYESVQKNIGSYQFYTEPAKALYGPMWERNKEALQMRLDQERILLAKKTG